MKKKKYRIDIRLSEVLMQKLLSICGVCGKTKTAVIEDLILKEFDKNKKYGEKYYQDFDGFS